MITRYPKTGAPDDRGSGEKNAEQHPGHDDACRCRETSQMTPRELLRLMINDLAFWKKTGRK